jgi:hypothetical protein
MAYYDEVFESQVGCGTGECSFGVRFTPVTYPATIRSFVISIQGGGTATNANIYAYLDTEGQANGPVGDPITLGENVDLSSVGELVQVMVNIETLNVEVTSGDIYIVIYDNGGFLGLANDTSDDLLYADRSWLTLDGTTWSDASSLPGYGLPSADFGILATFAGSGQRGQQYAITATGPIQPVDSLQYRIGRLANYL